MSKICDILLGIMRHISALSPLLQKHDSYGKKILHWISFQSEQDRTVRHFRSEGENDSLEIRVDVRIPEIRPTKHRFVFLDVYTDMRPYLFTCFVHA